MPTQCIECLSISRIAETRKSTASSSDDHSTRSDERVRRFSIAYIFRLPHCLQLSHPLQATIGTSALAARRGTRQQQRQRRQNEALCAAGAHAAGEPSEVSVFPSCSPAAARVRELLALTPPPLAHDCRFNTEGDLLVTCGKVGSGGWRRWQRCLAATQLMHFQAHPLASVAAPNVQDSNINLWWTDNGVRAGSFDGHNGVVWTCDMSCECAVCCAVLCCGTPTALLALVELPFSCGKQQRAEAAAAASVIGVQQRGGRHATQRPPRHPPSPCAHLLPAPAPPPPSTHPARLTADDSTLLLSAAGDSSACLWSMRSGAELFRFRFNEPARACRFSVGERMAAVSTDPFMSSVSAIRLFNIAPEGEQQSADEVLNLTGPRGRITRLIWDDANRYLLSSSEDGLVRRWDVEAGKCVAEAALHEKQISDMQLSPDGTHFITASTDRTAKLVDTKVCRWACGRSCV